MASRYFFIITEFYKSQQRDFYYNLYNILTAFSTNAYVCFLYIISLVKRRSTVIQSFKTDTYKYVYVCAYMYINVEIFIYVCIYIRIICIAKQKLIFSFYL